MWEIIDERLMMRDQNQEMHERRSKFRVQWPEINEDGKKMRD